MSLVVYFDICYYFILNIQLFITFIIMYSTQVLFSSVTFSFTHFKIALILAISNLMVME